MTRKERLNLQAAVNEQSECSVVIVAPEPDDKCELCGKVEETRPYGPNGENICYDCGMKDRVTTIQRMERRMFGNEITREEAESIIRDVDATQKTQREPE